MSKNLKTISPAKFDATPGMKAKVIGWTADHTLQLPDQPPPFSLLLKRHDMIVMPNEFCKAEYGESYPLHDDNICVNPANENIGNNLVSTVPDFEE